MRKMYHIEVGALSDFLGATIPSFHYGDGLEIIEMDGKKLRTITGIDKSLPVKTNAISAIITLSGEARIEIDTEKYKLHANSVLNLIGFKVLRNFNFSEDFKGYHLLLSKSYYDDVFRDGKHLPPEAMLYKTRYPYNNITSDESHLLLTCVENIIVSLQRKSHLWYHRIVGNAVRGFFMELGNIITPQSPFDSSRILSTYDVLFNKFMELVHENPCERRSIKSYADLLCISPDYLSQVIKSFTNRPFTYWLNEALVQQAKNLLLNEDLTLHEVALQMHFADQSSFGRFFKKCTGKSPAAYRRLFR